MSEEAQVMLDPAVTITKRRRPGWVWVICIFFFVSAGWTVLSYAMILGGVVPLNDAQRQYFTSLSLFDYASTLVVAVLNLSGAVLLFMLRRQAYYLFVSAFALGLLLVIYQILARHWLSAIMPGFVGVVIGWFISIRIITYARGLMKRGVLV